ncbi:hypothetical protein, partial [Burkholderia pseudomallei]|uniref:hypothetical protein n=1 Tax=Burkholderia pseudomallei TaxID=28450 RepID=UPI00207C2BEE
SSRAIAQRRHGRMGRNGATLARAPSSIRERTGRRRDVRRTTHGARYALDVLIRCIRIGRRQLQSHGGGGGLPVCGRTRAADSQAMNAPRFTAPRSR